MPKNSIWNSEPPDVEVSFENWGDNMLVSHWGDKQWIMFNTEEDVVELDEWR